MGTIGGLSDRHTLCGQGVCEERQSWVCHPLLAQRAAARLPARLYYSLYEIRFPRVAGYRQAIRNRVLVDWQAIATCRLDPMNIPPQVEMKAGLPNNQGRHSLTGPGKLERVDLNPYRAGRRFQALVFEMARDLTRDYTTQATCALPEAPSRIRRTAKG